MQKSFQSEWFGIPFSSLNLDPGTALSDAEFYRAFYSEFRIRYSSYKDLDQSWRKTKEDQCQDLLHLLGSSQKILSIGSGVGYLEFLIAQDSTKTVTAIEPYADFSDWMGNRVQFHQGYFPDALNNYDFDFVFLSAVDYALTDSEYLELLVNIKQRIRSKVALTGLHVPHSAPRRILHRIKSEFAGKSNQGLRNWGNFRSIREHEKILNEANYQILDQGTHRSSANCWILVV